ncbi:hypothetical protein [Methanosphaera sp. WGK6]|uniref:hypothetical protein n=1 Tax=Methanosphaera sp. WGK6 TaxID=1561964 RepID=UPI00084C1D2B|nr:hypothetical protein [Methanosphaera sp. WGK6]OED29857.1 hypothetical protein NL43_06100 [Methanosphaera sp. WGK6]
MDKYGQIAVEYLLIFIISMIILSIISIPLCIDEIDDISDIKNTVEVKNTLIELSNNVRMIYSSDYGSSKVISIKCPVDMKIYYRLVSGNHYLYSYVDLSDDETKEVRVLVPCKISFNGKSTYYYVSLKNRWYYNTEIKWINSSTGERSVNIYFK